MRKRIARAIGFGVDEADGLGYLLSQFREALTGNGQVVSQS